MKKLPRINRIFNSSGYAHKVVAASSDLPAQVDRLSAPFSKGFLILKYTSITIQN
jgi:hypothetical protein